MASRVLWALLLVAVATLPQAARAQGYFDYFFGPEQRPNLPPRPYPGGYYSPYQSYDSGYYQERPATYRTLCVRTCDGYYFPISFSTMRSEFARDADKCAASCGGEARLFYHPNPGGAVEDMVDLTGMSYADQPFAFKYRKSLVNGCTCRPQPWTEAELERHRSYARGEQRPVAGTGWDDGPSRTAARETPERDRISAYDGPLAAERPRPVSRYVLPSPQRNGNWSGAPFPSKRGSPAGLFR